MTVRIAVVGCGRWGPNHIRNFSTLEGSTVAAAVDPDAKRLERVLQSFPHVPTRTDYAQVLQGDVVDALVIATPTGTHYELVRAALLAGKHVLCEKPLCVASGQAEELAEIASERSLVLRVGHVFLFNSGIVELKRLIDDGQLGRLFYFSAVRTNLGPVRNDVNVAYDLASHDVSIFNWLIGADPESVSATGTAFLQPGIADAAFISLKYPHDIHANIHVSWVNPKKVRQITIVGSSQMVTWDDLELSTPVAIYNSGAAVSEDHNDYGEFLRISMWDEDVRLRKVRIQEPLRMQARHFIDSITGKDEHPISDGYFAARTIHVLEAINKSILAKGVPQQIHLSKARQDRSIGSSTPMSVIGTQTNIV